MAWAKAPPMEIKAKRTLVKSAPELWELADDLDRMEAWTGGLLRGGGPVEILVTHRKPERALAWRASGPRSSARVTLELAEKGFGTAVEITARHEPGAPASEDVLERLLDDLGSPERRPFAGG